MKLQAIKTSNLFRYDVQQANLINQQFSHLTHKNHENQEIVSYETWKNLIFSLQASVR